MTFSELCDRIGRPPHLVHECIFFADDFEELPERAERVDPGRVALIEQVRVCLQVVVVLFLHNLRYPKSAEWHR